MRPARAWAALALATVVALTIVAAESAQAQTLSTLHSFAYPGGIQPRAVLIQATDGNFYGTTWEGGASRKGTIFKITPSGALTTLHSFDGTDGVAPYAGLIQATNGDFYGTTTAGGANHQGTVFKITLGGTLTTLYSFCSESGFVDGMSPYAGLIQATDGSLYGTTLEGGADDEGTVFKIAPSGSLTTLYSFDGGDGGNPYGGLVEAIDGNFYGTTEAGEGEKGTVFTITPGVHADDALYLLPRRQLC